MNLHQGTNLISFYRLPGDVSVQNVFSSIQGIATGIIGEGVATSYIPGYGWVGSLSSINPKSGYWVQVELNITYCIPDTYPTNSDLRYNLHEGNNLISFPSRVAVQIGDALSDEVEGIILGVIGEGVAASYIDGVGWAGSLSSFEGSKGYWINTTEPVLLVFNFISD